MPIYQPLVRQFVKLPVPAASRLLQVLLALGVMVQGLILTGFAWRYTHQETEQTGLQTFESLTTKTKYLIESRLETYFDALHAGQGLFAIKQNTNRAEWKVFVEALNLQKRYLGMNGLGFIRAVSNRQKRRYELQVRHDLSTDDRDDGPFSIKPAGTRSDYFVIEYIEPLPANLLALGLDVKSEARRRAAAERARDTGEVAATQRIVLVQDQEQKSGLLILLPVYKAGMLSRTLEERRRALLGFVYAPLKTRSLIQEALAYEANGALNLQVYENQELLYDSDTQRPASDQRRQPLYQSTEFLEVAGQRWELRFTADVQFLSDSERQLPNLILSVGLLITVLLTAIVWSLVSSRGQALARNRAMLAAIPDLLLRLKRDGSCMSFMPPADLKAGKFIPLQKHISEVLPPDLLQHELQRIEQALATGELQVWEHQLIKNGQLRDEEIRLTPCGNDEVLIIIRDITERKQAEAEHREVTIALENAVSGISRLDAQGCYQFVNRSYANTGGYQPEEMIGMDWQVTVHPDDRARLVAAYQEMQQNGKVEVEAKGIRKDGSIFYKQLVMISIYDEQHQFVGHHCFMKDITERNQARIALEKELLHNKVLFRSSFDGIVVINQQGNVVEASQSFAQMLGYSLEEVATLHVADWDAQWTKPELMQIIQDSKLISKPFETLHRRKDGSLYEVEISVSTVDLEDEVFIVCICRNISDRKHMEAERQQAENALRESEARFQAFMNQSPTAAWITDAQGIILYFSQTYLRTFQLPTTDLIGKSIFELYSPDIAQQFLDNIEIVAQTNQVLEAIEVAPRADGTMGDFLVYKFPVPDRAGQMLVGGVAIDITLQHRAEEALRQSEATKQAIIQAIPDLLIRMRSDGDYVEFISNSRFNIFSPDQHRQDTNIYDVLPLNLAQLRMCYTRQALQSGTTQIYEQEILIEGKQCYEEVRIVPLPENEVLVMIRDITARKQAEAEVRHQKEMFQAIVDHIPVMIALFDDQGRIEFINPELEQLLGWSIEDWRQQDVFTECYPDPAYRQSVLEHMLAATGMWMDLTPVCASGQLLETSWANLRLSDGRFLGIGQDISDRKRKEIALRQAMEAAEAASLAKSTFLANMSHEFRTPLNVILGFTQVMAHDTSLTPNQQEDLQTIRRSGDHLLNLINDVLDLSKIEAGYCTLEETGFDLISLLHTLRTMMTERANVKQLQLEFNIAPEVPQFVIADEQKLRQILLNLLSNAIKFTHQGSVTLSVSAEESQPESALACIHQTFHPIILRFEVTDTGVGIAAKEQEAIFDAFVQAEAGKKSISGTGLGLTISRKLLDLMNGNISVQSIPAVGSTFTVVVPVRVTSGLDIQPGQSDRIVVGLVPGQLHHRVLVVDDQPENRLLLIRLLAQLGLEVREATNGQEAIRLWQEWQPDLIWMDIRMPGLDGYEATKQIRALEQEEPSIIIALTAQASQSDRALALAAGCNDYISKPFREETLFLKLKEFLGLEYLYAELPAPPDHPAIPSIHSAQDLAPLLAANGLAQFPVGWLATLEDAAVCGNDRAIADLAAQLPSEFAPLGTHLTALADQFQFEQILELVHKHCSN